MAAKLTKERALALLVGAKGELEQLRGTVSEWRSPALKQWLHNAGAVVDRVFGADSTQRKAFARVNFSPSVVFRSAMGGPSRAAEQAQANAKALERGFADAAALLSSLIREVTEFWEHDNAGDASAGASAADPMARLDSIFRKFHAVVRQLRNRHDNRPTLDVADEYDVQDLLHALLIIDFEDVRAEEVTPSYAGGSSRIDFLLKREQVFVEVKRTRPTLKAKDLGEQLIVDIQRYQASADCKTLVCFVYDPEGYVANPKGVIDDLEKRAAAVGFPLRIYIAQS